VRALAASARGSRRVARRFRGGLLALDYFGDSDLVFPSGIVPVRGLSLGRDLGRRRTIADLVRAALGLEWSAVVYAGGLENHPALLRRLGRRAPILGNGPDAVEAVRDPARFFSFLRAACLPHPPTLLGPSTPKRAPRGSWLFKPIRSGGGVRVRRAGEGERRPRGFYRQGLVRGLAASAVFVADGRRARILGVTHQIPAPGLEEEDGFRYGGNIAGPASRLLSAGTRRVLSRAVAALTERFALRGLNGIDFIVKGDTPHILEVNPRYTASMELLEDLSGRCLFDLHLEALERRRLPARALRARRFLAKGILYARERVVWPWSGDVPGIDVRDRPMPGETIESGHPVCTIVVSGRSAEDCRKRLEAAAARLHDDPAARPLGPPLTGPAPATLPPVRPALRSVLR